MAEGAKSIGASVRARLLKISKASGQSFEGILTRFALERLLFRLGQSRHADRFILKGAMLMMTWFDDPHRGTRNLDLLGFGDPDEAAMLTAFREIMSTEADDGLAFDIDGLQVDRIREGRGYGGLRLKTTAAISGARISLIIDIGFGDALEPGAEDLDYPSMLDFPRPRLRGYARETVIAEKFQAMVALGRTDDAVIVSDDWTHKTLAYGSLPQSSRGRPRAISSRAPVAGDLVLWAGERDLPWVVASVSGLKFSLLEPAGVKGAEKKVLLLSVPFMNLAELIPVTAAVA